MPCSQDVALHKEHNASLNLCHAAQDATRQHASPLRTLRTMSRYTYRQYTTAHSRVLRCTSIIAHNMAICHRMSVLFARVWRVSVCVGKCHEQSHQRGHRTRRHARRQAHRDGHRWVSAIRMLCNVHDKTIGMFWFWSCLPRWWNEWCCCCFKIPFFELTSPSFKCTNNSPFKDIDRHKISLEHTHTHRYKLNTNIWVHK